MDDLISRAALLKDLSYCAPELWQDDEYIKAKIVKQPTIDAIPVEWLVNLKNEYAHEGREQAEGDLVNLLLMWQKEQEAR